MQKIKISNQQARYFLLAHQGLTNPITFSDKIGILQFINRVGCIQFDPLNIVGHNHELVLQSRTTQFQPQMMAELLYKERMLLSIIKRAPGNFMILPTNIFLPNCCSCLTPMLLKTSIMIGISSGAWAVSDYYGTNLVMPGWEFPHCIPRSATPLLIVSSPGNQSSRLRRKASQPISIFAKPICLFWKMF